MSNEASKTQANDPNHIDSTGGPRRPRRMNAKELAEYHQPTIAILKQLCSNPAIDDSAIIPAKLLLMVINLKIRMRTAEEAFQSLEQKQNGFSNRIAEAITDRVQRLQAKIDEKLEQQDQTIKSRMEQLESNYDTLDSSLRSVIDTNTEVIKNLKAEDQKEMRKLDDSNSPLEQDGKKIRAELEERLEGMVENTQSRNTAMVMFLVVVGVLLVSLLMSDL